MQDTVIPSHLPVVMTPCLHCDPSSTHISALLALRLFFIFAPRRPLSEHLFKTSANVLSKPFLAFPPAGARQAVALGPRREYHLAGQLLPSWFLSCPELQVDFPRAAPIGLARHTHRPHRPCFRRFGRTSSAHTEGVQVPRGGACLWPWKHAHCFARATSDARTRCGTS